MNFNYHNFEIATWDLDGILQSAMQLKSSLSPMIALACLKIEDM